MVGAVEEEVGKVSWRLGLSALSLSVPGTGNIENIECCRNQSTGGNKEALDAHLIHWHDHLASKWKIHEMETVCSILDITRERAIALYGVSPNARGSLSIVHIRHSVDLLPAKR